LKTYFKNIDFSKIKLWRNLFFWYCCVLLSYRYSKNLIFITFCSITFRFLINVKIHHSQNWHKINPSNRLQSLPGLVNYDATKFASQCADSSGTINKSNNNTNEDCLYLNIHVPKTALNSTEKLSVLLGVERNKKNLKGSFKS
jgi:hypothetical protein